jgi:PAS domain S-box-containing protein
MFKKTEGTSRRFAAWPFDWLWVFMIAAAALIGYWSSSSLLGARFDLLISDASQAMFVGETHPDVVIVSVDYQTIEANGRATFTRRNLANLIDLIDSSKPRSILITYSLHEVNPNSPESDLLLADVLKRSQRVVLAAERQPAADGNGLKIVPPVDFFGQHAKQIGHDLFGIDDDGNTRSFPLFWQEGKTTYAHIALAALEAGGARIPPRYLASKPSETGPGNEARFFPANSINTISAGALLNGQVPANALANKYVVVGSALHGASQSMRLPKTPFTGQSAQGQQTAAHAMSALLQDRATVAADSDANALHTYVAIALALLAVYAQFHLLGWLARSIVVFGAPIIVGLAYVLIERFAPQLSNPSAFLFTFVAGLILNLLLVDFRTSTFVKKQLSFLRASDSSTQIAQPSPKAARDASRTDLESLQQLSNEVSDLRELYKETIRLLPVGVCLLDANGKVIVTNPRAAEVLGKTSTNQVLGEPLRRVFERFSSSSSADILYEKMAANSSWSGELADVDGNEHWVSFRALPSTRDTKNSRGVITFDDISSFRLTQRERDAMLNFISHDLRSPLNSVSSITEQLLASDELDGNTIKAIGAIDALVERASSLANEFIGIARAENLPRASLRSVDLSEIALEAAREMAHRALRHSVRLRVNAKQAVMVRGDWTLLFRAMTNLLDNALRASPANQTVTIIVKPIENNQAIFVVTDHGVGMSDAKIDQINRDAITVGDSDAHGFGLGLAFVSKVARAHHGKMQAQRRMSGGTRVSVVIASQSRANE